MDSEILKWIEQAPKSLRLSAHKKSFYNGEQQLKLVIYKTARRKRINPDIKNLITINKS